jgi:hypothetical protein
MGEDPSSMAAERETAFAKATKEEVMKRRTSRDPSSKLERELNEVYRELSKAKEHLRKFGPGENRVREHRVKRLRERYDTIRKELGLATVSRDPSNPKPGEVFESKFGNRWLVTGHGPKGRLRVKRAGNRFEGELLWTPEMFARLKQVRSAEAKAVSKAIAPVIEEAKEKPSAPGPRWFGGMLAPDPSPPRRYYVYVIEQLHNGKREFYVGQTGKTPQARFKEHKAGHFGYTKGALALRKDLYAKVNPLYSRAAAERMEKVIARTLRKRGLRVRGGH